MDNEETYHIKIKQLLKNILRLKYRNNIDKQLGELINHISHENPTEETTLIALPVFMEWIKEAVAVWTSQKGTPPNTISSFALKLAGLLSKNEDRFCALNNNNFFIKLVNVLKARQPKATCSVKIAYMDLLSSFLEHKSGIEWMMACSFWEDVFHLCLMNHDDHIVGKSHKFMSKLLGKTINHDAIFCHNVVKRMMQPLGENIYKSLIRDVVGSTVDEAVSQNLKPTLLLIGNVLEYALEEALDSETDLQVPFIFLEIFYSEKRFSDFTLIAQNKYLNFELGKIVFIMQFLEIYIGVISKRWTDADARAAILKVKDCYTINISKGEFKEAARFCDFGQFYWKLVTVKLFPHPAKAIEDIFLYKRILSLLLCLPNYGLLLQFYPKLGTLLEEEEEELRDAYGQQFMNMGIQDLVRLFYGWRDYFLHAPNLPQLSLESLAYIKKNQKHFSRDEGVLLARELIWLLKDTMFFIKRSPEILPCFGNHFNRYFSETFEIVAILINKFQITWKDGFETLNMLGDTFDFLTLFSWPLEAVEQALNLVNVSIAKYMTANLALLVDSSSDSSLTLLGPLLLTKLKDSSGHIRKAAVEVVTTMTCMSKNEFLSLQKVLIDSQLPKTIVEMSVFDNESLVRAAAIRSLQNMLEAEQIWTEVLQAEELPDKIRKLLLVESEKSIRIEAMRFVLTGYKHQRFSKDSLYNIYKTIARSSIADQSWQVRLRSLSFWDKVIQTHLQNQGMIDGSFPEVTFSKEQKKIVTLTDSEVRKRLMEVIKQLISVNCVDVIVHALARDGDMEVSKAALTIVQPLFNLFKKYKLYNLQISTNSESQIEKCATAEEFLEFACQDFDHMLAEKNKKIKISEELGLLLDDMIKIYEENIICTIDLS